MRGNNTEKPALLTVDDALAAIIATLPHTGTNLLPLGDALGFTLAEDLASRLTLPPQAVSAMDGYAVRGEDVSSLPCQLTRVAESAAGHPWFGALNEGQAVRVFTGATLPDGADTIIVQEDVDPVAEENGINITVRGAEPVVQARRGPRTPERKDALHRRTRRLLWPVFGTVRRAPWLHADRDRSADQDGNQPTPLHVEYSPAV